MDVADDVGAGNAEQLVVAFNVAVKVFETAALATRTGITVAAVLGFAELEALDHGAHGTVQNGDAVGQNAGQGLGAGVRNSLHGMRLTLVFRQVSAVDKPKPGGRWRSAQAVPGRCSAPWDGLILTRATPMHDNKALAAWFRSRFMSHFGLKPPSILRTQLLF